MKGLFLVLEGADGSGKSSQLELLSDFCKKSGRKVYTLHFPRLNEKPYGEMIGEFLRGEYGALDAVHPKLAALLYALDRKEASAAIKSVLNDGAILLADRYIFSNIAYQCAKVDDPGEREKLADWIENLEYGANGIPRPDLTLYLDAPIDFSLSRLKHGRDGADKEYLRGARDIHEESRSLQEKVRDVFLHLAKTHTAECGVVDCRNADGGMADRRTIHSRILDALRYYSVNI